MTYKQLCEALARSGIESPEWDGLLLAERFCGLSREELLIRPEASLTGAEFEDAVRRRMAREPLQYVLGEWAFYRQIYEVSPGCLIPRADTELLVEEAIARLPRGACFADLCTGSGCIAISVLAERPDTRGLALELSREALAIAARNAVRNRVSDRLELREANILDPALSLQAVDAILSNPPYIPTRVVETLAPEVLHEPRMALDGGEDGLAFYRAVLRLASVCLKREGVCLLEIGYDQGEALRCLAAENGFSCKIKKDYGGCDRVAILYRARIE